MAKRLVNQEARQAPITVHERVQEDETESGDRGRNQRIDVSHGLVGEGHQLFHQFLAKRGGWRYVAHTGCAAQPVMQMVLFVAKRDGFVEGVGDCAVLQLDQVVFGEQTAFVGLAQELNEATGFFFAGLFFFDGK